MTGSQSPLAVFFDLDGVLIDSRAAFVASINAALADIDEPARPAAELEAAIGPPLPDTFRELVDPDKVQAGVDGYYRHAHGDGIRLTKVFDGIPELLESLSYDLPLLVATSKPVDLAGPLLEALDVRHHFYDVLGPPREDPGEDKLATLRRATERIRYRNGVMIGDRSFDMAAARELSLIGIGVTWGIDDEDELRDAGAELVVDDVERLEAELRRLQRSAAGQAIR